MVTEACVSVNIPKDKKMQKKKNFNKSVNIAPWHYDKKSIELLFSKSFQGAEVGNIVFSSLFFFDRYKAKLDIPWKFFFTYIVVKSFINTKKGFYPCLFE